MKKWSRLVFTPPGVSQNIGAQFPKDKVQIEYVSFEPVITRSQVISIAKDLLHSEFNLKTDPLPADATVAIFSGEVQQPGTPATTNRKVWIVVVLIPSEHWGPTSSPKVARQFNVAIDATTREVLYSVMSGNLS